MQGLPRWEWKDKRKEEAWEIEDHGVWEAENILLLYDFECLAEKVDEFLVR